MAVGIAATVVDRNSQRKKASTTYPVCSPFVIRAEARLRRDAEQRARSLQETLENEYATRLAEVVADRDSSTAEAASLARKITELGGPPAVDSQEVPVQRGGIGAPA